MIRFIKLLSLGIIVLLAACSVTVTSGEYGDLRHIPAQGALGLYSAAVISGHHCFISGKIGERGGTFRDETASALDAVENELTQLGLGFRDVVYVTVYLTDMDSYSEFNEVYGQRLAKPYPARACVAVSELPGGARVEIQVIARLR